MAEDEPKVKLDRVYGLAVYRPESIVLAKNLPPRQLPGESSMMFVPVFIGGC